MIQIDKLELDTYIQALQRLKQASVSLAVPINESIGKTAESEKRIFEELLGICNRDLPELLNSTERLLVAINTEFKNADEQSKDMFTE